MLLKQINPLVSRNNICLCSDLCLCSDRDNYKKINILSSYIARNLILGISFYGQNVSFKQIQGKNKET